MGVKRGHCFLSGRFCSLTCIASFHIFAHKRSLLRPPEEATDQLEGTVPPRMSCRNGVMTEGGDALAKAFVGRDV